MSEYLDFVKSQGRPLSEINPGSDEFALKPEDALKALDILSENKIRIVGGDILTVDDPNKLAYAIHSWGYDYHYLNWYCEKTEDETEIEYIERSNQEAKQAIEQAVQVANRLNKRCLIVFII